MQGSAFTGRIAQSARYLTIVGLGPKNKAKVQAEWGVSPYQVGMLACRPLAPKNGQQLPAGWYICYLPNWQQTVEDVPLFVGQPQTTKVSLLQKA